MQEASYLRLIGSIILWLLTSWLYGDYLFPFGYPYESLKSDIEPPVSVNRSFAALFSFMD